MFLYFCLPSTNELELNQNKLKNQPQKSTPVIKLFFRFFPSKSFQLLKTSKKFEAITVNFQKLLKSYFFEKKSYFFEKMQVSIFLRRIHLQTMVFHAADRGSKFRSILLFSFLETKSTFFTTFIIDSKYFYNFINI